MIAFVLIASVVALAGAIYIAGPLARVSKLAAPLVAALIALGALGAYLVNGEPDNPDQPYEQRMERLRSVDPTQLTPVEQEERLRDAIRQNPDDIEAILLLGRYLARTERALEAIALFQRGLAIEPSARVFSDFGQALVTLNEGEVTEEAVDAFTRATQLDPALPEPAFFLGVAAFEAGDRAAAADQWARIIADLPEADPFKLAIAARAADLLSRPQGGPDSDSAAPFADAIEAGVEPELVIQTMVDGLALRLEDTPDDLSGWLALARARIMLDDPQGAREALSTARAQFETNPGKLAMITALERALQIGEEGA